MFKIISRVFDVLMILLKGTVPAFCLRNLTAFIREVGLNEVNGVSSVMFTFMSLIRVSNEFNIKRIV